MPIQSESEKIRLSHAREILARHLCSRFGAWTVEDDLVVGPGTLALRVEDEHRLGPQHLDIGFVLNRENEQAPVIWDCAVGIGLIEEKILAMAIDIWSKSTLPVILELLKRDGSEAAHFHDADPGGCPGWHVIHGPVLAYGRGSAPATLQSWSLQGNLLSHVGPIATKAFGRPMLNGVKLLFGFGNERIAEVRINGMRDQDASEQLRTLNWPQSSDPAFARCFLLFVHAT